MSSKIIKKKIYFVMNTETKNWIIEEGFSEEFGARNLKRIISKKIEIPLSCVLGDDRLESGDIVEIKKLEDTDDLVFEKLSFKRSNNKILSLEY